MKSEIGSKDLPEANSEGTEAKIRALFAENKELYFMQKELVAEFEKSNPCINKILRKLLAEKVILRKKAASRFYYKKI